MSQINMYKSCNKCGGEYEAKRADAKYCSDRCRKAHKRTETPSEKPQAPSPLVTETTESSDEAVLTESCPSIEHPKQGCCICVHLNKNRRQGEDYTRCKEKYVDCERWGVCTVSYHRDMCPKLNNE